MTISKYHRDRAKFQPKSSPATPCIFCSKIPTARAHLIPLLEGRKRGIPMKLLNEDWNLVNLCRGCHLLLDNKLDWWAKHETKVRHGVNGKELIDIFRNNLQGLGIVTYDFDLPKELFNVGPPLFGGADGFELAHVAADKCHTYIATKWGYFGIKGKKVESVEDDEGEEELASQIEDAWSRCWQHLQIPTTKEYRKLRAKCFEEAVEKRRVLVVALKDRIEAAEQRVNELLSRVHPVQISVGSLLNDLEVTGFDITTIRQGYITVFTFEPLAG